MKAYLMHADADFDSSRELPLSASDLARDLELDTLLGAMSAGDKFLHEVARRAILSSLTDPRAIEYRQRVLADCLANPAVARELYGLAVTAVAGEKKFFFGLFRDSPDVILNRSVQVVEFFTGLLKTLRQTAEQHAGRFRSEGFTRLFGMLSAELSDDYFGEIETHLRELKFRRGMLLSAQLGPGNRGAGYALRKLREQGWRERITPGNRSRYSFQIPARDDNGFRAVSELHDRGVNLVANALAQSADHILSFFQMLCTELAFYIGCLNLHDRLTSLGEPARLPVPLPADEQALSARGLYDPCLACTPGRRSSPTTSTPTACRW